MLRSVAISLAFLPLLTSFITASQSTLAANAGRALTVNATDVASIAEAATSAIFLLNIFLFVPRPGLESFPNDAQYSKMHASSKGGEATRFPGYWDVGYAAPLVESFLRCGERIDPVDP